MLLGASMVLDSISGMMAHNTLENGRKIKFQALASTHGYPLRFFFSKEVSRLDISMRPDALLQMVRGGRTMGEM